MFSQGKLENYDNKVLAMVHGLPNHCDLKLIEFITTLEIG